MKPGEVSQPIRASKSFQIYKLEKMTTPTTQPFESVRDLVAEKVRRPPAKRDKAVPRPDPGQALIVWKNEELKKAYEEQIRAEETPAAAATDPLRPSMKIRARSTSRRRLRSRRWRV